MKFKRKVKSMGNSGYVGIPKSMIGLEVEINVDDEELKKKLLEYRKDNEKHRTN